MSEPIEQNNHNQTDKNNNNEILLSSDEDNNSDIESYKNIKKEIKLQKNNAPKQKNIGKLLTELKNEAIIKIYFILDEKNSTDIELKINQTDKESILKLCDEIIEKYSLKEIVKKSVKEPSGSVILSKAKEPFKKIEDEKAKKKELYEKIIKNKLRRKLGYTPYRKWDNKNYERKLKRISKRSIIKLINSITEHKNRIISQQEEESKRVESKSKNFLMLHGLNDNVEDKDNGNNK